MVNVAPVMASETFEATLRGSEILEHDSRLLPWLSSGEDFRSESPWVGGEVALGTSWVGGGDVQSCGGGTPVQKPVWIGSATKPNILGSLSNSPDAQPAPGKGKSWGVPSTEVGHEGSTGTKGCEAIGSVSATITHVEGEDSDGGVEGYQDDTEDTDGDWAGSEYVSDGDGEVVSDSGENYKYKK